MREMAKVRQTIVDKHFEFGGGPFKFTYNSESRELSANMSGKKLIAQAVEAYPKPYQVGVRQALERAGAEGELASADSDKISTILHRADRFGYCKPEAHAKALRILCPDAPPPKRGRYDSEEEDEDEPSLLKRHAPPPQAPPPRKPIKKAVSLFIEYSTDGHHHQKVYVVGSTSALTGGRFVFEPVRVPEVTARDEISAVIANMLGKGTSIDSQPDLGQVVFGGKMNILFNKPLKDKGGILANTSPKCSITVDSGDGAVEAVAWFATWCV